MLIPSLDDLVLWTETSLSRRVNANSQPPDNAESRELKLIKKGEC